MTEDASVGCAASANFSSEGVVEFFTCRQTVAFLVRSLRRFAFEIDSEAFCLLGLSPKAEGDHQVASSV